MTGEDNKYVRLNLGNESLRENLTKEMMEEVQTVFQLAAENGTSLPSSKLPIALKAMGMSLNDLEDEKLGREENLDLDKFVEVVVNCMKAPNWAVHEMSESYALFDKDGVGNISPQELRIVFARLGETLLEREVEDQLREFDMDGDLKMAVSEYYKMISLTRGSDFVFEDSLF